MLGEISAVDPTIDPLTRSLKARAKFPIQDNPLRPGMFLRIAVLLPDKVTVTAVPATALVHASYGDSVFVVEDQPGPDGSRARPRSRSSCAWVKRVGISSTCSTA